MEMKTFYKPLTMVSTSCYLGVVLLVYAVGGVPLREESPSAVQLPIRRHIHPVSLVYPKQTRNRIRHLRNHLFANGVSGQPLARNFTDSGPFGDDYTFADEILTVDITLGTPARKYNVTIDYGWGFSFFFNAGNTRSPCVIGSDMPTRRWYNPKSSASAKPGLELPYGIGLEEQPYIPKDCFTGPEEMEDTVAMWTTT
ncbi:hypothetical protein AAVH_05250 [Aphelenchoides avenae]|nr:hypothetical protein AAVH_05250 [Aphelenchus avenae]